MKKTIFIFIFFIFSGKITAQNNLEFNRVIKEKNIIGTSTTLIVPTGKILKIISATVPQVRILQNNLPEALLLSYLIIDGHVLALHRGAFTEPERKTSLPLWLPAGTYNVVSFSNQESLRADTNFYSFSGIEFNIVQ